MIVSSVPPTHLKWLVDRTGAVLTPQAQGICVLKDGQIKGMVIYDTWMPNSVQMHMALDTPIAAKYLLRPAFEYPFVQCDRGIILGFQRETNTRARNLVKSLGFTEVHRVKDGWTKGEDMCIVELRRENCRWLKNVE